MISIAISPFRRALAIDMIMRTHMLLNHSLFMFIFMIIIYCC